MAEFTYSEPVKNRRGMWQTTVYDSTGKYVLVREKRTKKELLEWMKNKKW